MEFKAKDRRLEGKTPLRQCQLVQLYLLEILDEICKEHGLRYFLDFGTLLGAMRHNGAIPWDDDLDVSMPISDYKKFLMLAPNELPDGVLLQTPTMNGGFFTATSRLRDCKSFYLEKWGCYSGASGIFVDIYPLVRRRRYPNFIGRKVSQLRCMAFCSEIGNRIAVNYNLVQAWKHVVMASFWRLVDGLAVLCGRVISLGRKWCWTMTPELERSFRQFEDDDIFPLIAHQYEGREFPIPHRPEKLLETYYGNWRELPPEEKRHPYDKMKLVLPTQAPRC